MSEHELFEDSDKDAPEQILDRNGQVVLALCKKCGCAEGSLPTDCPGEKVNGHVQELIFHNLADYRNGQWRFKVAEEILRSNDIDNESNTIKTFTLKDLIDKGVNVFFFRDLIYEMCDFGINLSKEFTENEIQNFDSFDKIKGFLIENGFIEDDTPLLIGNVLTNGVGFYRVTKVQHDKFMLINTTTYDRVSDFKFKIGTNLIQLNKHFTNKFTKG